MKRTFTVFACLLSLLTHGQKSEGPKFDIADFNKKFEVVEWLYTYDAVAWRTSDSLMTQDKNEIKRLGREWFCFQDEKNNWHAVYGKYDNGSFDLFFHYTVDSNFKIKRVADPVDTGLLHSYSRALLTANQKLAPLKDSVSVSFNQFIKQNSDHTLSVWLLPAFQRDNTAVYGGEFIYTIDASGNTILKDDSYYQGHLRGFKADKPREIWLNYRDTEKPTLGAIFFVWYYKQYFTSITIDCAKSNSTVIKDGEHGYTWLHIEKKPE